MPAGTVRVEGLRELNAAFGKLDKSLKRELQKELRAVAEPVAKGVRQKMMAHGFSAPTITGVRAGSRSGTVIVRQRAPKKTGNRGYFGGVQMRYAFLPALEEGEPETVRAVEDMLDRMTRKEGF